MAADDAELVRRDGSKAEVGDRISADDNYGTIKFIGCVPPTNGLWLGVEWDDPSRGKHDGAHEGVKYFETSHPTSGSFVRPKKVELGQDCLQAVKERYGVQQDGDAGVFTQELFVLSADNKATPVEMVGAQKINKRQSQLNLLREVSVRSQQVYGVSPNCCLWDVLSSVAELDLSLNLIASWDMVARLCSQMSHLNNLHVSENRLAMPSDPQTLMPSFAKIATLFLNKMNLDWLQVLQCCAMFPALENLYLCQNKIDVLIEPRDCLRNISMINLEGNTITSWDEILKLGKLQKLDYLVISDNRIERLYLPDVAPGAKSHLFPQLKQLFFTGKHLKEWSTFDELNKLAELFELQTGYMPNLGQADLVREMVIAKIARLHRYNRTVVKKQERKGAEIDYLKNFGPFWLQSGGNQDPHKNNPSQEFLSQHPRFQEIAEKWGAPEDSEMVQQSKSMKDTLIALTIVSEHDGTVFEKKLPATMTVQKLRTLVQRLCRLDADFNLSYTSQKMPGPKIDIDNELRQLSYYSIESGDTIHVE